MSRSGRAAPLGAAAVRRRRNLLPLRARLGQPDGDRLLAALHAAAATARPALQRAVLAPPHRACNGAAGARSVPPAAPGAPSGTAAGPAGGATRGAARGTAPARRATTAAAARTSAAGEASVGAARLATAGGAAATGHAPAVGAAAAAATCATTTLRATTTTAATARRPSTGAATHTIPHTVPPWNTDAFRLHPAATLANRGPEGRGTIPTCACAVHRIAAPGTAAYSRFRKGEVGHGARVLEREHQFRPGPHPHRPAQRREPRGVVVQPARQARSQPDRLQAHQQED